jgi:HK97 family phage prohead protease
MASDTTTSEEVGASMPPSPDNAIVQSVIRELQKSAAKTRDVRGVAESKEDLYRADYGSDMELRTDGEPGRTLTGHFTKFNEWTTIQSAREGTFLERIAPGAFTKTIKENLSRMRVLFNHGHDVLGEQILGPIRSLEEDERGPRYDVDLFDSVPPLIVEGLKARQYGASFRFRTVREDYNTDAKPSDHNPTGMPERTLRELQVSEFGPVTFGAYPGATSGVRSLTDLMALRPFLAKPDLFRSALEDWKQFLNDLPAADPEDGGEATPGNAPTEGRAEQDAHPAEVRRGSLFWFTDEPTRSK